MSKTKEIDRWCHLNFLWCHHKPVSGPWITHHSRDSVNNITNDHHSVWGVCGTKLKFLDASTGGQRTLHHMFTRVERKCTLERLNMLLVSCSSHENWKEKSDMKNKSKNWKPDDHKISISWIFLVKKIWKTKHNMPVFWNFRMEKIRKLLL